MNTIDNVTYYTKILPAIVGSLPVLYIIFSILWNRKWVPVQRKRGIPTSSFGNGFKRIFQFAFIEDPMKLLPKVNNKITNKLLTLRNVNVGLIIASFAMLGLKNENAWIPFVLMIAIVWGRSAPVLAQRNQIFQRMYAVAASVFPYEKGTELNPWPKVQIKKWDSLTVPGETHVKIPAKWDASSLNSRDGFERHFNSTVTDNNSWIYEWKTVEGLVIARPINHLPTMASYPGSEKYPWSTIPLGVGASGEVSVDLTSYPHMLVCGTTGSGKSVLQRNLIFHCIQHNDMWRFLGVDVKRVELTPFKKYKKTVLGIGANLEDGVEIVRYAKEVMETRYKEMEERGFNHFKDLLDPVTGKPPYAVMLMVDEAFMFMSPEGAKTDEGKMRDQLHAEASTVLGDIARLGRASGVHLVLATQRPDATVIKGELKANLDIRVAAGRLDSTPSMMVLDSGAATMLPGDIKGRGIVRFGGNQQQFQGYFAPQEWIEDWLQAHPGVEPDLYPLLDEEPSNGEINDELSRLEEGYNFDDGKVEELEEDNTEDTLDEIEKTGFSSGLSSPVKVEEKELEKENEVEPIVEPEKPTSEPEEQKGFSSGLPARSKNLFESSPKLPSRPNMAPNETYVETQLPMFDKEPEEVVALPPTTQKVMPSFTLPAVPPKNNFPASKTGTSKLPPMSLPPLPKKLPPLPPSFQQK